MLSLERLGKITASSCHILFPKRDNKVGQENYARELAIARLLGYHEEVYTFQLEHGHTREVLAMDIFRQKHPFAYTPEFKSIGEYGGSADCMVDGLPYGVDFKAPTSLDKWLSYLDGIDHQQERQMQMYMYLHNLEEWRVIAFLDETDRMQEMGKKYPIPQDKRFIECIVKKDHLFEEQLLERGDKLLKRRDEIIIELKDKLKL